ncbi:hypothetical protein JCM11641_005520 [Rhodosporidiobolus odoratus]
MLPRASFLALLAVSSVAALPFSSKPAPSIDTPLSALTARQEDDNPLPYIGSPWGDWYRSTDKIFCEELRISFGGGMGPPYSIAIVNATTLPAENQTATEEVQVLAQVGMMGMPGLTWWNLDGSDLEVGTEVALQVTDGFGGIGYSVSRHISKAHLNEFCHFPGAFWLPSRWDSSHFIILLLFCLFLIPFTGGVINGLKEQWTKSRLALHTAMSSNTSAGAADVPLQERNRRNNEGATHVLEDDDDRTASEDEDRPLLRSGENARDAVPASAPPAYEDAVKEDLDEGHDRDRRDSTAEVRLV